MDRIKRFLYSTVGTLLITVGVYFFKIPNGFSTGGVSGIAMVLGSLVPAFTPGMLIFIINASLLLVGMIVLGKKFAIHTAYASLLFSVLSWALEYIVPISQPLTDQPFLELIYAILLTSFGSALLFHVESSSGGTDIIALILKKYTSIDVGKTLLLTDFVIASSSFFAFGIKAGMFSLLGLFMKAFVVDFVIESLNMCKAFQIITTKPEEVCNYIIYELKHSATTVEAKGAYSGLDKKIVITICKRIEGVKLKKIIHEIDPDAFVIATNTSEIIGRGFRSV